MVLIAVDPGLEAYHLWRRFSMPTDGGSRDAIAVPPWAADQLNAAYSFMVQLAILNFFALLILAGVVLWLGKHTHSHNSGVVGTGIWNSKGSPFEVFRLTSAYFFKIKDRRRWYLLVWMLLALFFVVASFAIPIKVAPYIIMGNAAPVSPHAIYIPSLRSSDSAISQVKINALEVPSALRAAGSVEAVTSSTRAKVSVDPPVILQELDEGETILRIDYRYNMSGVDFGLQKYPDLVLSVEGSCQTDYTWLIAESEDGSGVIRDEYLAFNDVNQQTQNTSLYDSARPLGYFMLGSPSSTGPAGNWTWGAIVSSIQRQSFSESRDPWYLTDPIGEGAGFVVRGGRPALSCWQNDVWSYGGRNSTVLELSSNMLPGLNLSPAIQSIFTRFLSLPKIPILATRLGASSLVSADTALGEIFDAGSSSVYADLVRLILASYIASMNTLSDTVLFPAEHNGIPNDVRGSDGRIQSGVDGFVVWSSQVRTLSIRALIIIPVVTLALFLLLYCLTSLPFSWYRIQALQATVLYSCLHEKATGHPEIDRQRAGDTPFIRTGDVEQAVFRPRFDKESRTLSWGQAEYRGTTMGVPTPMSPRVTDESRINTAAEFPLTLGQNKEDKRESSAKI